MIGSSILLAVLVFVPAAWAGPPTDQLREAVERVFTILQYPAIGDEAQVTRRRAAIDAVAADLFDFGDMAKQSLGQHWDPRTPAEREEFVRLYTVLIQRSYLSRVDQRDVTQTSTILGETQDGDSAVSEHDDPSQSGQPDAPRLPDAQDARALARLRHHHRRHQSRRELPGAVQQGQPE